MSCDLSTAGWFTGSAVTPNTEGAYSLWFKPTQSSANYVIAGDILYLADTDPARHAWYFNPTTGQEFATYLDGRTRTFAQTWDDSGNWHHVLFCWKKGTDTLTVYFDGTACTGAAIAGTWGSTGNPTQVTFGARYSQDQAYFNTRIAEIAIFDVLPSSGNATDLAAGRSPLAVLPSNTSYYWRVNSDGNPTTGVITLTLGGTATFDGAVNPTVDPPPSGAAGLMWL